MIVQFFGPKDPGLPLEILEKIFSYLNLKERAQLARISRIWNNLCKNMAWTKGFLSSPVARTEKFDPKYSPSPFPERFVACHGHRAVSLETPRSKRIQLWREENGSYKVKQQIALPTEVKDFFDDQWAFALTATHIVIGTRKDDSPLCMLLFWYPYMEASATWGKTQISIDGYCLTIFLRHLGNAGFSLQVDQEFGLLAWGGKLLSMFALPNATRGFLHTHIRRTMPPEEKNSPEACGWAFSNGLIVRTWVATTQSHLYTHLAKYTISGGDLKETSTKSIKMECRIVNMALSPSHVAFVAQESLDSSATTLNIYAHLDLQQTPVLVFRQSVESFTCPSDGILRIFGGNLVYLNPIRDSARDINVEVHTWSFWPEEKGSKSQFSIEKPEIYLHTLLPHLGGSWDPENGRVVLYPEGLRPRSGILQLWGPRISIDRA